MPDVPPSTSTMGAPACEAGSGGRPLSASSHVNTVRDGFCVGKASPPDPPDRAADAALDDMGEGRFDPFKMAVGELDAGAAAAAATAAAAAAGLGRRPLTAPDVAPHSDI